MDPFLSGQGRAAEQVQKGVIPNKSRAEEIATQQFNAAKKEQNVNENSKSSFFKRRKAQNHRPSKSPFVIQASPVRWLSSARWPTLPGSACSATSPSSLPALSKTMPVATAQRVALSDSQPSAISWTGVATLSSTLLPMQWTS